MRRDGSDRRNLTGEWLQEAALLGWDRDGDHLSIAGIPWAAAAIKEAAAEFMKKSGKRYDGQNFFTWKVRIDSRERALLPFLSTVPPESTAAPRLLLVQEDRSLLIRTEPGRVISRTSLVALGRRLKVARLTVDGALWRPGRPEVLVNAVAEPNQPSAGRLSLLLSSQGRMIKRFREDLRALAWSPDGQRIAFAQGRQETEALAVSREPFSKITTVLSRADLIQAYGDAIVEITSSVSAQPVAAWVPDSARLLVNVRRREETSSGWRRSVWSVDAQRLTARELIANGSVISVSPDGRDILLETGGRAFVLTYGNGGER
jgi:hypothetical protein